MKTDTQPLTQQEFTKDDFDKAERLAKVLGYQQTAYTSTSALWGMFCLPENPATVAGVRCPKCHDRPGYDGLGRTCKTCKGDGWLQRPLPKGTATRGGCIINTKELGLMFVQTVEDITGEVDI